MVRDPAHVITARDLSKNSGNPAFAHLIRALCCPILCSKPYVAYIKFNKRRRLYINHHSPKGHYRLGLKFKFY